MTLKIVAWNMAQKAGNWDVLNGWPELRDADVALLCEATPTSDDRVLGEERTEGLEIALGPDRPVRREWSTAIASPHPKAPITDARLVRYYGQRLPSARRAPAPGRRPPSASTT